MKIVKNIIAVGLFFLLPLFSFSEEYQKCYTGHSNVISQVSFSPDGKYIASGSYDNSIKVWDVATGECVSTLWHSATVFSVVFSPDGKYIASGSMDKTIKLWDVITGKCINTFLGHSDFVNSVAFSPDGKYIASGSDDNTIKLWDVATGFCLNTFFGHSDFVFSVTFSPDGKYIASGSEDGKINLWNIATEQCVNVFMGHAGIVYSVAFSPDGKYIASGSMDKTIKLWNVATGQCMNTFAKYLGITISSIAFSPDGNYIASGSWDNTVKLWDIASAQCVHTFFGHTKDVNSVAFSPDGNSIASGSNDYTIKLWDITKFTHPSLTTPPKPTVPPNLVISDVAYDDRKGNKNNVLNANGSSEIRFWLSNTGEGDAYDVVVNCKEINGLKGISVENKTIGTLKKGETKHVSITINSTMALVTSKANFEINVMEGNGFNADPVDVEILTQEFLAPKLVIADYQFSNENGGQIKTGVPINLKIAVQNIGRGEAKNVVLEFNIPPNVFATGERLFDVGDMAAGEKKELNFEFFSNKQYNRNTIAVDAVLKEPFNKDSETKTMSVQLNQVLAAPEKIELKGELAPEKNIELASLTADVDKDIPVSTKSHDNRYVLVIGNEDYSSYQTELTSQANVEFARNDANVFKEYCEKTLGVPAENITCLTDATVGKMRQGLDRMNKLMKNSDGKLEIIFYYAGHGLPDEKSKESYIMPVDVSGNDLSVAIKLSDVYRTLTEYRSKRVTVFLDACFSGGGRNEGLVAARTVTIKPKTDILKGNIVVFTASSGEQTSMPYKEKQHGFFTYFLLKGLQETKGDVTYKELSDYLNRKVGFEAVKINNREQNPETNISADVKDVWEKWQMK